MNQLQAQQGLQPGTEVNGYRILKMQEADTDGITYLAEKCQNTASSDSKRKLYTLREHLPWHDRRKAGTTKVKRIIYLDKKSRRELEEFLNKGQELTVIKDSLNIIRHQCFRANNTGYLVAPYDETGNTLAEYPTPQDETTAKELMELLPPLLEALDWLHEEDILHLDLKPENILLTPEGRAILTGIDLISEPRTSAPACYHLPTLPANATRQADIRALGYIFYRLITGNNVPSHPVPLDNQDEFVKLYPQKFLKSIDKAMAEAPEKRWASAEVWFCEITGKNPNTLREITYTNIVNEMYKRTVISGVLSAYALLVTGILLFSGIAYIALWHNIELILKNETVFPTYHPLIYLFIASLLCGADGYLQRARKTKKKGWLSYGACTGSALWIAVLPVAIIGLPQVYIQMICQSAKRYHWSDGVEMLSYIVGLPLSVLLGLILGQIAGTLLGGGIGTLLAKGKWASVAGFILALTGLMICVL